MLHNEIYKIMKRMKKKGFREGLRYIRKQIYSTSKYYVFRHNMENIPDLASQFKNFQFKEIKDPDCAIFGEIYRLWPSETRPNDADYIAEILREHSKTGAMCFVLMHEDHLIGATWISRPNHYYLHFKIPYLPGECISHWTFIISSYRGKGASKFLKSGSLLIAKQKGISSVISLVSIKNTPSIKMAIGSGFKIIGTIVEQYRMFRYKQYFILSDNNIG
jgi:GNAT superfamily N-acetyltransferase